MQHFHLESGEFGPGKEIVVMFVSAILCYFERKHTYQSNLDENVKIS